VGWNAGGIREEMGARTVSASTVNANVFDLNNYAPLLSKTHHHHRLSPPFHHRCATFSAHTVKWAESAMASKAHFKVWACPANPSSPQLSAEGIE